MTDPEHIPEQAPTQADAIKRLHEQLDQIMETTVRIPGQPAWIMLSGYAIGELAMFCALAGAFVEHHGHGIILIITPKHESVAQMYQHRFLKVLTITDELMRMMLRSNYIPQDRFELNQPMAACWIDRGFRDSDGIRYLFRYPGRGGISESDLMRFVLRLPWNSKLEPPKIYPQWEEEAWALGRSLGLRTGKSVLLCPINNSAMKIPNIFWDTLAATLIKMGYIVFTNMGGLNPFNAPKTMPIPATIPVNLPIHLVIPFAQIAGRMICGSNGMCFLTMLAGYTTFKITHLPQSVKSAPFSHSSAGYKINPIQFTDIYATFQMQLPEMCLKVPLTEFLIPVDGGYEELSRLADVVAREETSDESCYVRHEINGERYLQAHQDWLKDLVQ